ncbi:type IV secretory system conjugative DNA transfer family protein [Sporosarcina sp. FSL K6-1508]|uniref:type IV secretory system conjugative DNA transfer family protein n=1 Tax=Sporosarcina sp. FSL K6-1508 TaxID=2921553 RepID=UPI0030F6C9DF
MNEQAVWKQKAPLLLSTFLILITTYLFAWSWSKVASIVVSEYRDDWITYAQSLFRGGQSIPLFIVLLFSVFASFAWLLSTRVTFYQSKVMRVTVFFLAVMTFWGSLAAYGMAQSRKRFIPYFKERLSQVIETNGFFESIVFEHTHGFFLMLTMLPVFIMFFISLFILTKYARHDKELNDPFFEYTWNGQWLQKFSKLEQKERWPDIQLGQNTSTKEMVTMPGRDRTLNTMIVGSIGTGKTAALGLPMINQDLHHMVSYINAYPGLYEREDFKTEDVGGRYMSGISVIDPSNDLCQKTLELVRAHGIPEDAITYINPLDPKTPSINPMRGPVDKVAEVLAQVIAGLNDSKDGGNFFFEQAQRNHLKHYIYLSKLHDTEKEVTFDTLLDMYNNPQLVRSMHLQLKKTFPDYYEEFEDRDERNYWKIVQGIDEWFDLNLLPKTIRSGNMMIPELNDDGQQVFFDAKEEHVQGLRNILNDIGANPLIRRVLFGKSDFDFDRHMEIGGVLLVNTAKGELVNLARVLGKIVLMNLQNATFRRLPNVSTFHHILIDEAPDYLYNAFREFPAQSRKYKVTVTTLQQTIAQLADQFGEHYMTTLIGTMRNRMVYGDVPAFDAKYFSDMFGEKTVYEEGQSEMSVSPLQEDPMSRSGSSYSKVREQSMSGGDIMFQDAFQCAVKIVINNKPMPVVQIAANFVPKEDFKVAKIVAEDEAVEVWLRERRQYGIKPAEVINHNIISVEEAEKQNEELFIEERKHAAKLNQEMIEQAVRATVEPKPRDEVDYKDVSARTPRPHPVELEDMLILAPPFKEKTAAASTQLEEEIVKVTQPLPVTPISVPVSVASTSLGLSDIISEWTEDDDEDKPPRNDSTQSNSIHSAQEQIMSNRSGYTESQLSQDNEDFIKKLGVSVEHDSE